MGAGLFGLEERHIVDKAGLEARQSLLQSRGLSVPGNEDCILGLYQGARAGLLTWTLQRATRVLCVSTDLVR